MRVPDRNGEFDDVVLEFDTLSTYLDPSGIRGSTSADRSELELGSRTLMNSSALARGYDHNWILNQPGDGIYLNTTAYEPITGRVLEALSDQPGLQLYSGNFLDGTVTGTDGLTYKYPNGFLHGATALSRLAQSSAISIYGTGTGADLL